MYSDSINYIESNDSLYILYYSSLGTTIALHLSRPTPDNFVVDTARSWIKVYNDRTNSYDSLEMGGVSMLTEVYTPGGCCTKPLSERRYSQPSVQDDDQLTPTKFKAQVLGMLSDSTTTRTFYLNFDIATSQEESSEC